MLIRPRTCLSFS